MTQTDQIVAAMKPSELAHFAEVLELFNKLPPAKQAAFMEFIEAATGKHGGEFEAVFAEFEPKLKAAGFFPDA